MSTRETKGLEIANKAKITRKGNLYLVPSLAGNGLYTVDAETERCTCPDFEFRRATCKHIFAVSFYIERTKTVTTTTTEDGKAVTKTVETETVKVEKRVSYLQGQAAKLDKFVQVRRQSFGFKIPKHRVVMRQP